MKKILVTYPIPKQGLKGIMERFDVTYPEQERFSKDELRNMLPEYDGILLAGARLDANMIGIAKNLKIISVYGAGYDNVDIKAATSAGIVVTNTPDAVTESTAELAFGLMLAVMRRIAECDRKLRCDKNFRWSMMTNLGTNLYGKTLGIIGMGRIGRAVARRAKAFGMDIYYHNRRRLDESIEKELGASYYTLDELLEKSDVVSLNVPLTEETYHLIGKKQLDRMKPSAFIINTSRGAVIDEKVLVKYLQEGRIAGAGLDVFEHEPKIPQELLKLDRVVLTPHIGTSTLEARTHMAEVESRNIVDYFEGRELRYIVNPEVL